jgi:CHAT domain-containing protein
VLSQKGNPPDVDGYVTASEWPLYDVKSDLTVLSACDTGVGRTQAGESVMGLPYALFVAGNKNTLLSLWPVEDNATAEFMRRFFAKLKAGVSQPDALSQTKQEFSKEPKWSHPAFWAAFVLYGV